MLEIRSWAFEILLQLKVESKRLLAMPFEIRHGFVQIDLAFGGFIGR